MRSVVLVAFASFITACSSGSSAVDPGADAGADSPAADVQASDTSDANDADDPVDASDSGFVTAKHTALPQLSSHSGTHITNVQLVTLTFDGDTHRDDEEAFGDAIVTSGWMIETGGEYGVGKGTHAAKVRMGEALPSSIKTTELLAKLQARFGSDVPSPLPETAPNQYLYAIYVPRGVTVLEDTTGGGVDFCTVMSGYHNAAKASDGHYFPYALVVDCGTGAATDLRDITVAASHEIMEACSDPFDPPLDGVFLDRDLPDPWYLDQGDENADLCNDEIPVPFGSYSVQRIWSNAGAKMDQPCVPVPAGSIYFNVSAEPHTMPTAKPGDVLTFTLTGWSTGPRADWTLDLADATNADYGMKQSAATLSSNTINNGKTVTLTMKVPNGKSGNVGGVFVQSGATNRIWPVGYVLQ